MVKKYNNEIVDGTAQAFAKLAGRDWTFMVTKLNIIIGRPNAKKTSITDDVDMRSPMPLPDIDLGPDQQISRIHAHITYNHQEEKWILIVVGRNGVYVDDIKLNRDDRIVLRSGHIINIVGTQMMFLLPTTPAEIHPEIQKRLLAGGGPNEDSETEEKEDQTPFPQSQSSIVRGRGRTANAQQSTQAVNHANRTNGQTSQLALSTPAKGKEVLQPKLKSSPSYYKGVLIESAEEMDYSLESSKDIKPPLSYAALIGQAILSTSDERATLAYIYSHIKEHYAFFRHAGVGWQNSIRHNLSLSKCFEKIPRETDEPGKGMKWQIVPSAREEYLKKNMQPSKRPRGVGSSVPTSPAVNAGAAAQTERLMQAIGQQSSVIKNKRIRSVTPPLASYPRATESYTPDRGPQASFLTSGPLPAVPPANTPPIDSNAVTPSFSRTGGSGSGFEQNGPPEFKQMLRGTFNSPPTLTNTTYDRAPGAHLFTPLPPRSSLLAAVQSTAKAPSFYAKDLFSSPAPFWKFADIGSTPARVPELSPLKTSANDIDDPDGPKSGSTDEDEEDQVVTPTAENDALVVKDEQSDPQPSSPPGMADYDHASPTRTVSRPISRNNITPSLQSDTLGRKPGPSLTNGQGNRMLTVPNPTHALPDSNRTKSVSPVTAYQNPLPMLAMQPNAMSRVSSFSRIEEDDDGEIDLTR